MVRRTLERFLNGDLDGRWPRLARVPLLPLAASYGAGARLKRLAHARGWLRVERLPLPTVSVGNPTAGGTGKTPFVRLLCELLLAAGERPAILARGYGASAGDALDEEGAALRRDLPGISIRQDRRRARAAAAVRAQDPSATVFLLDDGAQHLAVRRDLEILLVDARRPFGTGHCPPAGLLREPPGPLLRIADLAVLTRCDEAGSESVERARRQIAARAPGLEVLEASHRADRLLPGGDPGVLRGQRVWLASGIARPDSFRRAAEALGATVVGETIRADHHPWRESEVRQVAASAREAGARHVLTTGKDEPKFRAFPDAAEWRALEVRHALRGEDLERLRARLLGAVRAARGKGSASEVEAAALRGAALDTTGREEGAP